MKAKCHSRGLRVKARTRQIRAKAELAKVTVRTEKERLRWGQTPFTMYALKVLPCPFKQIAKAAGVAFRRLAGSPSISTRNSRDETGNGPPALSS
jgi:hypothetical protein